MKVILFDFIKYLLKFGLFKGFIIFFNVIFFNRVRINGSYIYLRSGSNDLTVFKQIFLYKEYNIELPEATKFIIDAGANVGFTSLYLNSIVPNATILSIEPDNENFNALQRNIKNFQKIIPIKGALWFEKTMVNLVSSTDTSAHFIKEVERDDKDLVETFTISELSKMHGYIKIDVLKIDIESAEKEIFEHFEDWLPSVKFLMIELHDRMKQGCSKSVFTALSKFNFSVRFQGEIMVCENLDLQ